MTSAHIVEDLSFDIDFSSEDEAFEAQERLVRFAQGRAQQVIAEVFDEAVGSDAILRLETLQVDVGTLTAVDFEERFAERLRDELRRLLGDRRGGLGSAEELGRTAELGSAAGSGSAAELEKATELAPFSAEWRALEARSPERVCAESASPAVDQLTTGTRAELDWLLYFVEHGCLPWHAPAHIGRDLHALAERVLADNGVQLARALRAAPVSQWPTLFRRLVAQFPPEWLAGLGRQIVLAQDRGSVVSGGEVLHAGLLESLPASDHDHVADHRDAVAYPATDAAAQVRARLEALLNEPSDSASNLIAFMSVASDIWRGVLRDDASWLKATLLRLGRSDRVRRRLAAMLPDEVVPGVLGLWLSPAQVEAVLATTGADKAFLGRGPPNADVPREAVSVTWVLATLTYVLVDGGAMEFSESGYRRSLANQMVRYAEEALDRDRTSASAMVEASVGGAVAAIGYQVGTGAPPGARSISERGDKTRGSAEGRTPAAANSDSDAAGPDDLHEAFARSRVRARIETLLVGSPESDFTLVAPTSVPTDIWRRVLRDDAPWLKETVLRLGRGIRVRRRLAAVLPEEVVPGVLGLWLSPAQVEAVLGTIGAGRGSLERGPPNGDIPREEVSVTWVLATLTYLLVDGGGWKFNESGYRSSLANQMARDRGEALDGGGITANPVVGARSSAGLRRQSDRDDDLERTVDALPEGRAALVAQSWRSSTWGTSAEEKQATVAATNDTRAVNPTDIVNTSVVPPLSLQPSQPAPRTLRETAVRGSSLENGTIVTENRATAIENATAHSPTDAAASQPDTTPGTTDAADHDDLHEAVARSRSRAQIEALLVESAEFDVALVASRPVPPDIWRSVLRDDTPWLKATLLRLGRGIRVRRRLAAALPEEVVPGLLALWLSPAQVDSVLATIGADRASLSRGPSNADVPREAVSATWVFATLTYILVDAGATEFSESGYRHRLANQTVRDEGAVLDRDGRSASLIVEPRSSAELRLQGERNKDLARAVEAIPEGRAVPLAQTWDSSTWGSSAEERQATVAEANDTRAVNTTGTVNASVVPPLSPPPSQSAPRTLRETAVHGSSLESGTIATEHRAAATENATAHPATDVVAQTASLFDSPPTADRDAHREIPSPPEVAPTFDAHSETSATSQPDTTHLATDITGLDDLDEAVERLRFRAQIEALVVESPEPEAELVASTPVLPDIWRNVLRDDAPWLKEILLRLGRGIRVRRRLVAVLPEEVVPGFLALWLSPTQIDSVLAAIDASTAPFTHGPSNTNVPRSAISPTGLLDTLTYILAEGGDLEFSESGYRSSLANQTARDGGKVVPGTPRKDASDVSPENRSAVAAHFQANSETIDVGAVSARTTAPPRDGTNRDIASALNADAEAKYPAQTTPGAHIPGAPFSTATESRETSPRIVDSNDGHPVAPTAAHSGPSLASLAQLSDSTHSATVAAPGTGPAASGVQSAALGGNPVALSANSAALGANHADSGAGTARYDDDLLRHLRGAQPSNVPNGVLRRALRTLLNQRPPTVRHALVSALEYPRAAHRLAALLADGDLPDMLQWLRPTDGVVALAVAARVAGLGQNAGDSAVLRRTALGQDGAQGLSSRTDGGTGIRAGVAEDDADADVTNTGAGVINSGSGGNNTGVGVANTDATVLTRVVNEFVLTELFEEGRTFDPEPFARRLTAALDAAPTLRAQAASPPQLEPALTTHVQSALTLRAQAVLPPQLEPALTTHAQSALTLRAQAVLPPQLESALTTHAQSALTPRAQADSTIPERAHSSYVARTSARAAADSSQMQAAAAADDDAVTQRIYIANAGIVIVGPYLPRLFAMLGLTNRDAFTNLGCAHRAVHLIQYIVTRSTMTPEPMLVLNKILCGLPVTAPIPLEIDLRAQEQTAIDEMLTAIIAHWKAIGRTSIAGLRESFLQRAGRLVFSDDAWRLRVESRSFDMLLDRLPWGYGTVKYPWMRRVLHVDWR